MNKLLIILLLAISGCSTISTKDAVVPPAEKTVNIDPRALELCSPIIKLIDESELLETTIKNFEIYADCANKQKNSVILLKKFSNYKEESK